MLGRLKRRAYDYIARNRDGLVARKLHDLSLFVSSAYNNENLSFEDNGELLALQRLAAADFKVAFDVGANVGAWSEAAARVWPGCGIRAFEIAPITAKRCLDTIARSRHASAITLHQIGLSNEPGTLPMYFYPDHDDLTCDMPRFGEYRHERFEGKVTTVDAFCSDHDIRTIDFLKIDVEGAEYKVLQGAESMLKSNSIKCIQFEYGAFSLDTRFLLKDYHELLGERYALGKIFPQYVDFSDFHWRTEDFRFCNYLCVSKQHDDLRELIGRR